MEVATTFFEDVVKTSSRRRPKDFFHILYGTEFQRNYLTKKMLFSHKNTKKHS